MKSVGPGATVVAAVLGLAGGMAGCSRRQGATPPPATSFPASTPTASSRPGSAPASGAPAGTPAASASPSPGAAPGGTTTKVKIFLVLVNDDGRRGERFGCNDSIVAVDRAVAPTATPLRAALQALLDDRKDSDPTSGEVYNVFYASTLTLESATIDNGKAIVRLNGQINQRGICDAPRVQTQLEKTARQFPGVSSTEVFVGGRPLADVLSLR